MGKWSNWDDQLRAVHNRSQSLILFYLPVALLFLYTESSVQTSVQWTKREYRLIRSEGFFEVFVLQGSCSLCSYLRLQGHPVARALLQPQHCPSSHWVPVWAWTGQSCPFPEQLSLSVGVTLRNNLITTSWSLPIIICFPLCKGGNKEPPVVRLGLMLALSHLPGIGHASCALIKKHPKSSSAEQSIV